ncbi:MAG TPA: hypothetical protein DHV42_02365 [Lachnospiraceae bacterium]|nr:hypothetical protein [Lachnospiraceae bacterium]
MSSAWKLPDTLTVNGRDMAIRTDYRDILEILRACSDPELPSWARTEVMLKILYVDFDTLKPEELQEAADKAVAFIDNGSEADQDPKRPSPRLMDWEQDAELIVPAINRVANCGDIRSLSYLHWWTFLGYYMEIGECLFSSVLNIRYKRAHGKKLDKWEKDFEKENRRLISLKKTMSETEKQKLREEKAAVDALFGL